MKRLLDRAESLAVWKLDVNVTCVFTRRTLRPCLSEASSTVPVGGLVQGMGGDLDEWIALVRKCELIPERDLKHLCEYVQEIMLEESTVQPVQSPVTICGDIHGQVRAYSLPA